MLAPPHQEFKVCLFTSHIACILSIADAIYDKFKFLKIYPQSLKEYWFENQK